MATMKKAQVGAKVKKTFKSNPDSGGVAPFTDKEQRERRKKLGLPTSKSEEKAYYAKMSKEGARNGKSMTKAKTGISVPKKNSVSKNIGNLNKAKNGKSFPDLNKDGKITKADILKGRGVIAKKGASIKKAQDGVKYTTPRGKEYALPQGASGPLNITRPNGSTRTIEDREKYTKKMQRVMKRNTVDGINQGTITREKNGGAVKKKMKSGGSMKKCKYGCK